MGFVGGFILVFMIFWIILLIVLAVFAILCIVFSATSASKAKQFFASHQYPDFKKAKGRFIAALVFFILTCLASAGTPLSLEYMIETMVSGYNTVEDFLSPAALFVFVIPPALLIAALALGIRCFVWYGRANKLHKQLSAAASPVQFFTTAQSFIVCPLCGSPNNAANSFCVKCGQILR